MVLVLVDGSFGSHVTEQFAADYLSRSGTGDGGGASVDNGE